MPPKPKIFGHEAVGRLRECYIDKKMSTTDIAAQSKEIFGLYVGASTVYKELVRYGIPLRDKSESVSRAMSTLDIDRTFMTDDILEWIDGLLLGDGYINFKKDYRYQGARFVLGSSERQWSEFGMSRLGVYGVCEPFNDNRIDKRHPNLIWSANTKTHPDIVIQAKRWYAGENYKKIVPADVRITPTSILLWYLGDGSFTYEYGPNIAKLRLATCAFPVEQVMGILIPKLESLGLRCKHDRAKNDVRICSDSIGRFFDIIGHRSPIACYDHKFQIPDWLRLIRLSDIVDSDKQRWMAQYYYKSGQLECTKSPGGRMLLFTPEQAGKLRSKLA